MKITKIKEVDIKETPHKVDVRNIYNHDNAQVMHITLRAGESLKPHITPVDVFFYILEGDPHVLVGEEKIQVSQDTIVESPKDIIHSLYNETDKIARILVVKAPRPTAGTKMA
ncbi:MAG: cupin domain-containing protein [Bacteroidia bacterium]|jgi:quercetin dioxygenase-like cupin family protein|nr:cupin domain-containing protein [Bacteroidia bacterium]